VEWCALHTDVHGLEVVQPLHAGCWLTWLLRLLRLLGWLPAICRLLLLLLLLSTKCHLAKLLGHTCNAAWLGSWCRIARLWSLVSSLSIVLWLTVLSRLCLRLAAIAWLLICWLPISLLLVPRLLITRLRLLRHPITCPRRSVRWYGSATRGCVRACAVVIRLAGVCSLFLTSRRCRCLSVCLRAILLYLPIALFVLCLVLIAFLRVSLLRGGHDARVEAIERRY